MTYNKAKCEKGPAFDDSSRHVATVVALADDALIALDLRAKGVLAADEEEEDHDGQPKTRIRKILMIGES